MLAASARSSAGAYKDALWSTAVLRLVPAVCNSEATARAVAPNAAGSVVDNAAASFMALAYVACKL